MNLDITGRNLAITPALRQSIEERLTRLLERETLKITAGKVVLNYEKGRCTADVVVSYKNHDAAASASGYDMYLVVEEALARIDRQMGKCLERVQTRRAYPLREVTAPTEPMPVPQE